MKKPSKSPAPASPPVDPRFEQIIGLGARSMRKTHYPELQDRLTELERFRMLFDVGYDLILVAELPSGRLMDANYPLCSVLDLDRPTLLGLDLAALMPGDAVDALLALAPGRSLRIQTFLSCADRRGLPVELTARAIMDSNGTTMLIVCRDITERQRIEGDLRHAIETAERANAAKSQFLAAASHDLRQPAQSLMLLIETLTGLVAVQPAAKVVAQMAIAAETQKSLLDGLLDISRLDACLIQPQIEECELGPMIERLAEEYRPRAMCKGLTLRVVPTRAWVRTDLVLLERILRNLVDNALKYTETGKILLGCRHGVGRLRFEIRDTGIGIPPDQIDRVFDEFYQINNPARDRAKGLGLGLAIVRRLAQLLGITVELDSRPGRGSCFALNLPLEAEGPLARRSSDRHKSGKRK